MRAVMISQPGPPEVLQVQDVPDPEPGPGEVVINITATAINRADLVQRKGKYTSPDGAAPIPGLECSGTIAALGDSVVGWEVGDEVCALLTGGGYAEQVAVPAGQLMSVPKGVDLVTAAALPEVTCTVWSMVFGVGRLQPGERVLVHGGSSGVGTMAIQLVHQHGSIVFATAGSARKLAICRDLGADIAIDYRDERFEQRITRETNGAGVGLILDNMGGSYLSRNVASLGSDSRLIVLGVQGGRTGELDLGALLAKRCAVHSAGLRGRPLDQKAEIVAETQRGVWPLIESDRVRPIVDRVLPLEAAADGHRLVESSEHIGKVLLRT